MNRLTLFYYIFSLFILIFHQSKGQNASPVAIDIVDVEVVIDDTQDRQITASDADAALQIDNPTIVIMGSSTAAGWGASTGNDWVSLFDDYLTENLDAHTLHRLAVAGYGSYHFRETGYTPPGGRPSPDNTVNITAALALNPDIIIVNLPSNDVYSGYAESETITNLSAIQTLAEADGVEIFFHTTQPRNLATLARREELYDKSETIKTTYAPNVINTYDLLTDFPGLTITTTYDSGDGIHLSDAGHEVLLQQSLDGVEHLTLGDTITFEVQGAPSFMTYNYTNGVLDFSVAPEDGDQGTYPITVTVTDLDGNTDQTTFSIIVNDLALPVEWLSFEAKQEADNVMLVWRTASETNNEGFDIEKSFNGIVFNKLSFVDGHGTTNDQKDYSYVDTNVLTQGRLYYRLKQIDYDGEFEYSDTVKIELDIIEDITLSISHDTNELLLQGNNEIDFNYAVYSINGHQIHQTGQGKLDGIMKAVNQKISGLERSMYLLTLTSNQKKWAFKFVKL